MTDKPKGSRGLWLIAAFKLVKGLGLLILGIGVLNLLHKDVAAEAERWINLLRFDPHNHHIEKLLAPLPRDCGIVTVIDGHPATLGWLGSVRGHRVEALGVEHFGQTGTISDLYRHHGIDANAIIDAAESVSSGGPVRHRKMAV